MTNDPIDHSKDDKKPQRESKLQHSNSFVLKSSLPLSDKMYKQSTFHASVPINSTTALNILTIKPQDPEETGSSLQQVNPQDGVTYRTKHFNFTPSPTSRSPPASSPSYGSKKSPPPVSPLVTGVSTSPGARQTPTPPAKPQKKFTFSHSGNSSPAPQSPISPVPQSPVAQSPMPNGVTVVSTEFTKSILTNGRNSKKNNELQSKKEYQFEKPTFDEVQKPRFEEVQEPVQSHEEMRKNSVQSIDVPFNSLSVDEENKESSPKRVSFAVNSAASEDSESDLLVSPTSSQASVSFNPPTPPALPQGGIPPPPPPLPQIDPTPKKVDRVPPKVTTPQDEKKSSSSNMMSELKNKLSSVKKDFETRPTPTAPIEMGKPKLYIGKTPRSPPPKQRNFSLDGSEQSSPVSSPSMSSSSVSRTPSRQTDSIEKDDNDSLIGSSEIEDSKSEHSYSTGSGPGQDHDSACESDEEVRAVEKPKKCQRVVLQNDADRVLLLQVCCEKEETAKSDKFIDLLVSISGTVMSYFKKKKSSTLHLNGTQVQHLPIGDRPVKEHITEVERIFEEKIEVVGAGCAKSADKVFVGQKLKDRVAAKGPCQIGKSGSLCSLKKTNRLAPVEEFSQQLCDHIIEAKPLKLGKIQTIKVLNKKGKALPKDQLLSQMFESDYSITVYEAAKKCFVEVTDFTVFT